MMSVARTVLVLLGLELLVASFAFAGPPCPLMMVRGTGDHDGIHLTFRNVGKLAIRALDFSCTATNPRTRKQQTGSCREDNGMFYPGPEYNLGFAYPNGKQERVRVSLRSALLIDGYLWRPSKGQGCRVLNIQPEHKK
jgi:hypothetical protein